MDHRRRAGSQCGDTTDRSDGGRGDHSTHDQRRATDGGRGDHRTHDRGALLVHRLYDEQALARLAFVQRAKALGVEFDDLADLVRLWDGTECAPIQERLRSADRTSAEPIIGGL